MEVLLIFGLFVAGSVLGLLSAAYWTVCGGPCTSKSLDMAALTGTLSTAALIGAGYVWGAM